MNRRKLNEFSDSFENPPAKEPQLHDPFSPARFRFSLTRLAVALVAATLPLLFIADWNREYGWIFGISSVAIAGVALRIRAANLPRLNVALQLVIPCMGLFACGMCFAPHWL